MPGVSIGLDTQGQGQFNEADTLMRYDVKAMGIFAAASKNWVTPLGNLGLHMGTNYNFAEVNDGDILVLSNTIGTISFWIFDHDEVQDQKWMLCQEIMIHSSPLSILKFINLKEKLLQNYFYH